MSSPRRQRRCVICRHGFVPHPRVGDRQRACGGSTCQKARRKRNQDDWLGRHPTIITTNLAYEEWHAFLGNKHLVDALLSRLRHQCTP